MSAARSDGAPALQVLLGGTVQKARRDVLEAEAELAERPSYDAGVKLQVLRRHWNTMRAPALACVGGVAREGFA